MINPSNEISYEIRHEKNVLRRGHVLVNQSDESAFALIFHVFNVDGVRYYPFLLPKGYISLACKHRPK